MEGGAAKEKSMWALQAWLQPTPSPHPPATFPHSRACLMSDLASHVMPSWKHSWRSSIGQILPVSTFSDDLGSQVAHTNILRRLHQDLPALPDLDQIPPESSYPRGSSKSNRLCMYIHKHTHKHTHTHPRASVGPTETTFQDLGQKPGHVIPQSLFPGVFCPP